MDNLNLLKKFAEENEIYLSEKKLEQFEKYRSFLIEKNKVINLTAIDDPEGIEIKHFIDSLAAADVIEALAGEDFSLVDIGCGAGFPGIPLKIVFPQAKVTLVDSVNKKINCVNEAIKLLGLKKAETAAARAEDLGRGKRRESFDICVSRAVADTGILIEYCLPLVEVGGYCILYKSGDCAEEIQKAEPAVRLLGGEIEDIKKVFLPKNSGERSLVIISKEKATPAKYPRRPGKPSKSPISNSNKKE